VIWAWELITKVYGLPEDRLWVTVFGGTETSPETTRRSGCGATWSGFARAHPAARREDNFWRMGDTGPCGPCSEIHIDLGADLTSVAESRTPTPTPGATWSIWNLVFMQFEQKADGSLDPLPARASTPAWARADRLGPAREAQQLRHDSFNRSCARSRRGPASPYGASPESDTSLRSSPTTCARCAFSSPTAIVPANDNRGTCAPGPAPRIRHALKLGSGAVPARGRAGGRRDPREVYPESGLPSRRSSRSRAARGSFGETVTAGLHSSTNRCRA